MTRSGMLCVLAFGLLSTSGCARPEAVEPEDADGFKEFNSAAGRYKVRMPGAPKEETKTSTDSTLNIAVFHQENGDYMVMFTDLPISGYESEAEMDQRLDKARDVALQTIRGKLTKETKTKLAGKYPGYDFEAELPDKKGAMHAKVFLVGKRLYQVITMGTIEWTHSAESAKFMNSFTLVE